MKRSRRSYLRSIAGLERSPGPLLVPPHVPRWGLRQPVVEEPEAPAVPAPAARPAQLEFIQPVSARPPEALAEHREPPMPVFPAEAPREAQPVSNIVETTLPETIPPRSAPPAAEVVGPPQNLQPTAIRTARQQRDARPVTPATPQADAAPPRPVAAPAPVSLRPHVPPRYVPGTVEPVSTEPRPRLSPPVSAEAPTHSPSSPPLTPSVPTPSAPPARAAAEAPIPRPLPALAPPPVHASRPTVSAQPRAPEGGNSIHIGTIDVHITRPVPAPQRTAPRRSAPVSALSRGFTTPFGLRQG